MGKVNPRVDSARSDYRKCVFDVLVDFAAGSRVRVATIAVSRTNLHTHSNALEIVYVLRGTLRVRVSIDNFDLGAGDYVVINRDDPHFLEGCSDNITAVISLDLAAFADVDPFCEAVVFACESFGLARYRRQESLLRSMLLDIVEWGTTATDAHRLADRTAELVQLLCRGYSLENYYRRDTALSSSQRDRLLGIVSSVRANLFRRDVLAAVAQEHHYSKSYVSHAVKELGGVSFADLVTGLRMAPAEKLLLTTDATTAEISAACGFSHVKYFTRSFQDWLKQTPADFRRRHRPETLLDNKIRSVAADTVLPLVEEHRHHDRADAEPPQLSITPLVLKNVGSGVDLFEKLRNFSVDRPVASVESPSVRNRHLVPIKVSSDEDTTHLMEVLHSVSRIHATPCLVLDFASKSAALDAMSRLAETMRAAGAVDAVIWLVYPGLHARTAVDEVVDSARENHGLAVQAVLMA